MSSPPMTKTTPSSKGIEIKTTLTWKHKLELNLGRHRSLLLLIKNKMNILRRNTNLKRRERLLMMKRMRSYRRTSRSSPTALKPMMEQLMELQRRKVFGLCSPKLKLRPHRMSRSRMRKNLKKSKRKLKLRIKKIIRMMTLL